MIVLRILALVVIGVVLLLGVPVGAACVFMLAAGGEPSWELVVFGASTVGAFLALDVEKRVLRLTFWIDRNWWGYE